LPPTGKPCGGAIETVYGYVPPDQRREALRHIGNLRVVGYEVVEGPRMRSS